MCVSGWVCVGGGKRGRGDVECVVWVGLSCIIVFVMINVGRPVLYLFIPLSVILTIIISNVEQFKVKSLCSNPVKFKVCRIVK